MSRSKPRPEFVRTLSDIEWRNASLSERALHVARSQDAVREASANWSPAIRLYLAAVGWRTPAPWCAAFVAWCLLEAGADRKKLPMLAASTYWWWRWAEASVRLRSVADRGRLGLWNGAKGGHIWFCLDDQDPHRSIEGNTNPGGGREGYGVFDRRRSEDEMRRLAGRGSRWGFVEIDDDLFAD